MRETLRDWQSRFGSGRAIAAPQIGAPVRMVYVEMDKPWPLINPEIVDIGTEDFTVWDDCFSFPNLMVQVSRAYRIRVHYQDIKGDEHEVDLEGDRAELLQHEIDHLDGVLAVDRPHGLDPFCLREEWNRLHAAAGRYGEPGAPARALRHPAHRPALIGLEPAPDPHKDVVDAGRREPVGRLDVADGRLDRQSPAHPAQPIGVREQMPAVGAPPDRRQHLPPHRPPDRMRHAQPAEHLPVPAQLFGGQSRKAQACRRAETDPAAAGPRPTRAVRSA